MGDPARTGRSRLSARRRPSAGSGSGHRSCLVVHPPEVDGLGAQRRRLLGEVVRSRESTCQRARSVAAQHSGGVPPAGAVHLALACDNEPELEEPVDVDVRRGHRVDVHVSSTYDVVSDGVPIRPKL